MTTKFSHVVATRPRPSRTPVALVRTPISRAIPGREAEMIPNHAGNPTFEVTPWVALERFLILGTEGSTYYVTEEAHTIKMFDRLMECINQDARRVVDMVVDISHNGRAAKNDQALFALAAVMKLAVKEEDRYYARMAVNAVARIGTHILHLAEFVDQLGGWGTGTRKAFKNWFLEKGADRIAYQAIKYGQRDGWSMRDLLRKAHPWGTAEQNATFEAIANPEVELKLGTKCPPIMWATQQVKKDEMILDAKLAMIKGYDLPREVLPTEMLNDTRVWDALLPGMKPEALIRNLGKLTSIGMLQPLSDNAKFVQGVLTNAEEVKSARLHPLKVLMALATYKAGKGIKGSLTWHPTPGIVDALEQCLELSFNFLQPSGKNVFISVDVSASMRWEHHKIAGTHIYAADAAACMAMVTAKVEQNYMITAFTGHLTQVDIQKSDSFSTAVAKFRRVSAGGTNISLPMLYAAEQRIPIDIFQIYTDNDTTMGKMHPSQALQQYRREMGRPRAKLAVVATVASEVSVADPKDPNMMDFAGFDANAPQAMASFAGM